MHEFLGPGLGQRPHVTEVAPRPTPLVRERLAQVHGKPVDHPAAPAGLLLPVQGAPADQYNPSSSLFAARTRSLSCSSSSAYPAGSGRSPLTDATAAARREPLT